MSGENKEAGCLVGFVLLEENEWDKQAFIGDFKADWDIDLSDEDSVGDTLVVSIDDMTLAVAIMPAPVPDGEAEHYAKANYMWNGASEAAEAHKAHILVSVIGDKTNLLDRARLFTKAISSCLKQKTAIAVYTDGMVYQPEFYDVVASFMKEDKDALPILVWVWFGINRTEEYAGIYTYGMRKFGKEEFEMYGGIDADLNDIRNILLDMVSYVLDSDVALQNGETIGFSADQKLSITLNDGIALDGKSLKIEYPQV